MSAFDQSRADLPQPGFGPLGRLGLAPLSPREDAVVRLFATLLLIGTVLTFAWGNIQLDAMGGASWIQGEWLSNFAAGLVRRGFSGEFVFAVSDATGLDPLALVTGIEIACVATVIGCVLVFLWRYRGSPALVVLAVLPSFVDFWHGGFATHAKEILALCAFVPVLCAGMGLGGVRLGLCLSGAVFFIAAAFYEPAVLFAPALVLAAHFVTDRSGDRAAFGTYGIFIGLSAVLWLGFAVLFASVPDFRQMCAPLLQHGLSQDVCTKFRWFGNDVGHAMTVVDNTMADLNWGLFAAAVALSAGPVAGLAWDRATNRTVLFPALVQSLVFLPLYWIGTDYGRWLNLQVTSVLFILFTATATGRLPALRHPRCRLVVYPLLALALCWTLSPMTGEIAPSVAVLAAKDTAASAW